jgi:hypothetical protein
MHVSSQETGHRPEHQRLLEMAEGRTEEACHGLLTGERLPHQQMTMFRYFCMATLTITHRVPEETVVDFKVTHSNVPSSRFLFPSNFDSARFELFVSSPTIIVPL